MRRHKSAAQPVQIARQAVDAARAAAQNVDVAEVRDTITTQAVRAAEAARDAAQSVDLGEVRDTVTTEVSKANEIVLTETRQRPMRALLIAVGLGAVLGAVVDRMRRPKTPPKQQQKWGPPA